jgi:hypothetical protein
MAIKKKAVNIHAKGVVPKLAWGQSLLQNYFEANAEGKGDFEDVWSELKRRYVNGPKREPVDWTDLEGFASFDGLQGCCALAVAFDLEAPSKPERWTKGMYLAALALELLDNCAKSCLLATTVRSQVKEIDILRSLGFKAISTCINPKTKNEVTIWLGDTKL